jgi:hypothetical protein
MDRVQNTDKLADENREEIKMIRFIDSQYNTLFHIPDGGKIRITYPEEDMRGIITRNCKYKGEMHVDIGNNVHHICEFAEIMERLGAKYEPETPYILQNIAGTDAKLYRNEENPRFIGYLRGNFGNEGTAFWNTFFDVNPNLKTPEFKADFDTAINKFKETLLKDRFAMNRYCDEIRRGGNGADERFGFKAKSEKYEYYINAFPYKGDYNFYVYCYERELDNIREINKGVINDSMSKLGGYKFYLDGGAKTVTRKRYDFDRREIVSEKIAYDRLFKMYRESMETYGFWKTFQRDGECTRIGVNSADFGKAVDGFVNEPCFTVGGEFEETLDKLVAGVLAEREKGDKLPKHGGRTSKTRDNEERER